MSGLLLRVVVGRLAVGPVRSLRQETPLSPLVPLSLRDQNVRGKPFIISCESDLNIPHTPPAMLAMSGVAICAEQATPFKLL